MIKKNEKREKKSSHVGVKGEGGRMPRNGETIETRSGGIIYMHV